MVRVGGLCLAHLGTGSECKQLQETDMRRVLPFLIFAVLVVACSGDTPVEPATAPDDLHAKLTGPPDLSGVLPQFERRVFIHYRPGFARPEGRGKPKKDNGGSKCFSLLGNGAKWKTIEPYSTTFLTLPVATWNEVDKDIFGRGQLVNEVREFDGEMDDVNTAQFGPYPNPNVLAVTVVWGIFIGPPRGRELVEWDILMNDAFTWGDATKPNTPNVWDIANVATHELGHAAGLGHPPDECTEETMYAFAASGETKKRTLEAGDIAGILGLY
jgi:hypothetical protein